MAFVATLLARLSNSGQIARSLATALRTIARSATK
jgi:hypothetical protein